MTDDLPVLLDRLEAAERERDDLRYENAGMRRECGELRAARSELLDDLRSKLAIARTALATISLDKEENCWHTYAAIALAQLDGDKPRPAPLSQAASDARKPHPPDYYVGALQDRVHEASGKLIAATPLKVGGDEPKDGGGK